MKKPVLILQMQRLGDIILSFPMFLWMRRSDANRVLWVVAEPIFYNELLGVSPPVTYLPWTATEVLGERDYELIINLSHRREAAELAGKLEAGGKIGPALGPDGLRIQGQWQLYRASLTGNDRHNRFHWAELNALDCVDKGCFPSTRFDSPRLLESGPVGLFLGASQEEKRPSAAFWAALARELERRGQKVVLLGGPGDVPLGEEVRRLHGGRLLDLCGKLGLKEFSAVGQTLSLMVTPDTGPMHLAAWSGLLTLNLSMGPVNPWETGPYQPGHYVLRADMSCLGCWKCRFGRPRCIDRFDPVRVAYLVRRLTGAGGSGRKLSAPSGTRLYRTGRTPEGFYDLVPQERRENASDLLGEMWRGLFGAFFGLWDDRRPRRSWRELRAAYPRLAESFTSGAARLAGRLRSLGANPAPQGEDFWTLSPPMIRPLAGYMHMLLENSDFSPQALARCLEMLERLGAVVSR